MDQLNRVSSVIVVIGALNWGFLGVFDIDVLYQIFESPSFIRVVYSFIGLCGLFKVICVFGEQQKK